MVSPRTEDKTGPGEADRSGATAPELPQPTAQDLVPHLRGLARSLRERGGRRT